MYMWVTFRITQENMSDAPPLSGRALNDISSNHPLDVLYYLHRSIEWSRHQDINRILNYFVCAVLIAHGKLDNVFARLKKLYFGDLMIE